MKHKSILFITIILLAAGCSDDAGDRDYPRRALTGRWMEVARGNNLYPELEPDGSIIEFTSDSYYITSETKKYVRIDNEFIYYNSGKSPDGHTYRYTFSGIDVLRLDHVDGAMTDSGLTPYFHIYKRLK
jgi:hypothetical protein